MYCIDNESPEDITARMLRRIPIEQLYQQLGNELLDKDFLYTHGYTLSEYIEASTGVRIRQIVDQINSGVRKAKANRDFVTLNNTCQISPKLKP